MCFSLNAVSYRHWVIMTDFKEPSITGLNLRSKSVTNSLPICINPRNSRFENEFRIWRTFNFTHPTEYELRSNLKRESKVKFNDDRYRDNVTFTVCIKPFDCSSASRSRTSISFVLITPERSCSWFSQLDIFYWIFGSIQNLTRVPNELSHISDDGVQRDPSLPVRQVMWLGF